MHKSEKLLKSTTFIIDYALNAWYKSEGLMEQRQKCPHCKRVMPMKKNPSGQVSDEEFLAALKTTFKNLAIEQELSKMDAWLMVNPGRQKTRRFIVNWLTKAADRVMTFGKQDESSEWERREIKSNYGYGKNNGYNNKK